MQLSNGIEITHPYFASVSHNQDVCEVVLSEAFPAAFREFTLRTAPEVWEDLIEVEGTLGLVEEDGRTLWLQGSGRSFEEAIQSALATFTNWVVHPADVNASHFCIRPVAA
jgi:hypothetical protein